MPRLPTEAILGRIRLCRPAWRPGAMWEGRDSGEVVLTPRLIGELSHGTFATRLHERLVGRSSRNCIQLDDLLQDGQLDRALDHLDEEGPVPSVHVYRSLLRACAKRKALFQARKVHGHIVKHGLQSVRSLAEDSLITLVKCEDLAGALQVFHQLKQRTVFAWTAMISGYAMCGHGTEALRMYELMQQDGVQANKYTFVCLAKACGNLYDLEGGRRIHADVLQNKCECDVFVGTSLINMYGKCGSIPDAQDVFVTLSERNVVSWNAMLAAYVQQAQPEKALQLYEQMTTEGVSPDAQTFVGVLQACAMVGDKEEEGLGEHHSKLKFLAQGKAIHFDASRRGYDSNLFLGNTLVNMYGKCGSVLDAQHVFDTLSHPNVVSWTVMLAAYSQQGEAEKALQLYEQMCEDGVSPDPHAFVCTLQACGMTAEKEDPVAVDGLSVKVRSLKFGRSLHADARRKGYDSYVFVGNSLVSMYGKCGVVRDAHRVFDLLVQPDVVSWNALVAAYVEQDEAATALLLYREMRVQGLHPDDRTFVNLFQACAMVAEKEDDSVVEGVDVKVESLQQGKCMHADAWWMRHSSDLFVGNSLINMYGKCGSVLDAQHVFEGIYEPDVVSWTALAAACAQQGDGGKALQFYEQLRENSASPNDVTFVVAVQACGLLAEKEGDFVVDGQALKLHSLAKGKALHADSRRRCYDSDVYVGSVLISMYGKCGSILDAEHVFHALPRHTVVSWNAMLTAYIQLDQDLKAFQLYREMRDVGVSPNEVTGLCILQVCTDVGGLDLCRQIHHSLVCTGKKLSGLISTAFIHVYGKCSSMEDAQKVFDARSDHGLVAWNALIAGYARQGHCVTCLLLYEKMLTAGVKPNGVTFLIILSACSHAGLVDKGVDYFEAMVTDHGVTPEIEHYVSVVDLLSRAGYFTKVKIFLSTMPLQPNVTLWLCLLGACRKHGKVTLGELAFQRVLSLEPKNASAYLLMSNIYADAGLLDRARYINEVGQRESGWKKPGQSWIEHGQELHTFVVRDQKHPQQIQLYDFVEQVRFKGEEGTVDLPNSASG